MKKSNLILAAAGAASVAPLTQCTKPEQPNQTAAPKRPNIVMVMVDDMGFSDIGSYGSEDIKTPNLDKLAYEGTRFRQFYNNSISAPTRASLITGQFQHKAGIGFFSPVDLGVKGYEGHLNNESRTFAEVLHDAGYATFHSGKWHVGNDSLSQPIRRGFDHSFNFQGGASVYYDASDLAPKKEALPEGTAKQSPDAKSLSRGNRGLAKLSLTLDGEPYKLQKDEYLTHAIADHALDFISDHEKKTPDQPFFLYLAFNAPHWPLQAPADDIAKYKDVYKAGWDSLRYKRWQGAVAKGVVSPTQQLARHDGNVREWDSLTEGEKGYWQTRQEVYAAMVDVVDQQIGRLLDKLRETGDYDNTLIVFISDNGAQGGGERGLAQQNATGRIGDAGTYYVQNSNWSQADDSPFRNYKSTPYEGGISAPFIAWWPGHIQAGRIADGIGHLIDIAPTFYDIAGATYPTEVNGQAINPLPGKSLTGVLLEGQEAVDRNGEPLVWEWAGNKAVRLGKWKYVWSDPLYIDELYDIEADRAENNNLASKHPEIVSQLKAEYDKWAQANGVVEYKTTWPHFRW